MIIDSLIFRITVAMRIRKYSSSSSNSNGGLIRIITAPRIGPRLRPGIGLLVQELGEDGGHVDVGGVAIGGVGSVAGILRGGRGGGGTIGADGLAAAGFAAATADGDVAEGAAFGPVSAAGFAEVAGLREAVVVEVAELGAGRSAARAVGSDFHSGLGADLVLHQWRW